MIGHGSWDYGIISAYMGTRASSKRKVVAAAVDLIDSLYAAAYRKGGLMESEL